MIHLVLIIKGDKFAAVRAASQRQIPLIFDKEVVRKNYGTYTYGFAPKSVEDKVRAWYGEDAGATQEYQDGSLQLFGKRETQDPSATTEG
jgi:hypothetical protein